MDLNTARAIINESPLPLSPVETEAEAIELATRIVRDARVAYGRGIRGEPVRTILELAKNVTVGESESDGDTPATKGLTAALRDAGLPSPPVPPDSSVQFPSDLTACDDRQLRSLASQFTHFHAYSLWRLGVEESDVIVAERMVDKARRETLNALDKVDPVTGKNKLAIQLEAEVGTAPLVEKWTDRLTKHEAGVRLLRAERDIYQGYLDRISREMTARHNEYERSLT